MAGETKVNQDTGEIKVIKGTTKKGGAFFGRTDGYVDSGVDCSNPLVKVFKRIKYPEKTGENDEDFIMKEKVVVTEVYNQTDRANSYKNDSDVYGIMDKVLASGDASLLYKESGEPTFADIHDMPHDLIEAGQAIEQGATAYRSLDEAFTKGASMEYIAKNFTQKEIDAYIDKLKSDAQPKPVPAPAPKGDDK